MHVERRQVGPSAPAGVLMLDPRDPAWSRRRRGVRAASGLDAGFLVGGDDELVGVQRSPLPLASVEVEDPSRFGRKLRVAREEPAAMAPGPDGIVVKPPPNGLLADPGHNAAPLHLPHEVRRAET